MKTHKFAAAAFIAAAALGTAAFAQPAAVVNVTPAVAAPNEVVYVPQLPSVAELSKAAAAQGVTVTQIDQTASQISVTYKYSNGATNTVSYQPLSAADSAASVPQPGSPAPAVAAGTTVVYTTPAPAYYYGYPSYGYYPWGWYPPVSIGLGFGFHGGGGFRGGFGGGFHGRFR